MFHVYVLKNPVNGETSVSTYTVDTVVEADALARDAVRIAYTILATVYCVELNRVIGTFSQF